MSLFQWFLLVWGIGAIPFLLYSRHLLQGDDFKSLHRAYFLFRWSKETHMRMLALAMYLKALFWPFLGWPVLVLLIACKRLKNYILAKRLERIIKEKVEKGEYIVVKLPEPPKKEDI